ncbi:MAG: transcriptional regulator [Candidatus Thorarchaeota archaeon]|nr:transcriptional regulator [Candidatus Thorarchaeota archaeon]
MTTARGQLIDKVITTLEDAGFDLSSRCDVRPSCFDLVARKGEQLILVKMLSNIDSITEEDTKALQLVAHFFNATPLIVGMKTRRGQLDPGVVYKRYGISTIAPTSLSSIIDEQKMPREFIQRGGRFVAIDGAKLREARISYNITKEELASCVEVSARAILAYEKDEMDVSKDVAMHLEKVLETDLVIPIDIISDRPKEQPIQKTRDPEKTPDIERRVNIFFERLGMRVLWSDRAPFHVAAKEEGPPLMTGIGSLRSVALQKRMELLKSVSHVTESEALIIVEEGHAEENIANLPIIRQLELDDIEKPRELKKIISERSGN